MSVKIGSDVWVVKGHEITTRMRHEILLQLAEQYLEWEAEGCSYEWDLSRDPIYGDLVPTEQQEAETDEDFFGELTGWRPVGEPWWPLNHEEHFEEWLEDYLRGAWGEGVAGGWYRGRVRKALNRVRDWVAELKISDLLAWRHSTTAAA